MNRLEEARFGSQCELARQRFYYYCKYKAPDFYNDDRPYIQHLCDELQAFLESDDYALIINMPPRFGKSRTGQNLVEWALGKNNKLKIMTASYNETLSTTFSKGVRNSIMERKADPYRIVYTDVFPGVGISPGDARMDLWSLNGGYQNYLATSPGGTATGFGANLLVIDDLIKNAKEAYNDGLKEEHWRWFTDTMLSRLEKGGKIIIIMTRWATNDFAGRAIEEFEKLGRKIRHINMKAMQDDGNMLCDSILSAQEYEEKKILMGADIFLANYQQDPIDIKGRLYTSFKTYTDIPRDAGGTPLFHGIRNYTDTADAGDDYLCSIVYGIYQHEAYILDVLYTQKPMEYTEPATASMLMEHKVNLADIESNNGGKGFARNVKAIMQQHGTNYTTVKWFHQSANKKARILTNATWVMNHIYFPVNWKDRWPEFYQALITYQKEGKNLHDDAPDALTGVCEMMQNGGQIKINTKLLQRRRW